MPLWSKLTELCLYLNILLSFSVAVTTAMCCLECALCTVWLERYFIRRNSVMWFWPFYHNVTDSRQVSPITGSVADNGTFTF
jgi:hypothetical protein